MNRNRSIAFAAPETPRPDAGFSVVLVTATILVLLILGLALVSIVSENSGLAVDHVQSSQAFYVAQAGLEFAVKKLGENPSWRGVPPPGKSVGPGAFTVAPPDTVDEHGAPLPPGRKRLVATGVVGEATRVLQVEAMTGGIALFAGTGSAGYAGDGGAATAAAMKDPGGLAIGADGSIYVADTDNHVVRRIDPTSGVVTTVAGSGSPGWTGDGLLATAARLQQPHDVAIAPNGDLYIADTGNHAIRRVAAATGVITTVAGNGSAAPSGPSGPSGDGAAAIAARLNAPCGIAVASNGDLYVADRGDHKIRKIAAASGIITTVAGTGTPGYAGDGGPATAARLRSPEGVELASNGDLYIADTSNDVVRRVAAANGIITTIAGTGATGYAGDGGTATAARLNRPAAIAVGASGDLYVADRGNHAVRRVASDGTITTFAGVGAGVGAAGSGDAGAATAAALNAPSGLAVDRSGVVYVADTLDQRIRRIFGRLSVVGWLETRS